MQVTQALDHASGNRDVVHRDIKPSSVLIAKAKLVTTWDSNT